MTLMWYHESPNDNPPFGWKESVHTKLADDEWKALTMDEVN